MGPVEVDEESSHAGWGRGTATGSPWHQSSGLGWGGDREVSSPFICLQDFPETPSPSPYGRLMGLSHLPIY